MAVKVRVSYEKTQELYTVIELLKPIIKSCKSKKGENGQYKRAYLEINIPMEMRKKA